MAHLIWFKLWRNWADSSCRLAREDTTCLGQSRATLGCKNFTEDHFTEEECPHVRRESCHWHSHRLLRSRHSPEICFRDEAMFHPRELSTQDDKRHVRLSLNCTFLSLRSLHQGCRLPPPEEGGDWVHPAAKPRLHLTKQKHKLDVWQTNLISEKLKSRPLWLLKMMDANIMFSLSNCCFGGYPIPIKTTAPKHYCIMLPFWNKWL